MTQLIPMLFDRSLLVLCCFFCPARACAQSVYVNQGSKDIHFVERMEIKKQKYPGLNFSSVQPFNRKYLVEQLEFTDSIFTTKTDSYNLNSFLMNNREWVTGPNNYLFSRRPVLKYFYKTKPNLIEINKQHIFFALNPVLQYQRGIETKNNQPVVLGTIGFSARGLVGKRLGFATFIAENHEKAPLFVDQWIDSFHAVPGAGYYRNYNNSVVRYLDARGYITFKAADEIDVQIGYDKNFIGNGYRSLLLSDWGNSNLFLKINTRVWKINYQNLFMELKPQFSNHGDSMPVRKYAAIHHLSMNVTKWLNIGLFEAVIFGRKDHFDFQYLNPIIFYRHIEGAVGSPDNAVAGFEFKANIAHRLQLYGQFLLDEFVLSQVKNNPTSWVNKWGIQAGLKYIDAFGIHNLDIQLETNRVRPFTYTHSDTISNYTHYNQPLAHPLGANFQEGLAIVRYQPAPRWYLYGQAILYYQGLDSASINFGSNIFRDYRTRNRNEGFKIGSGNKVNVLNAMLQVSYEMRENLFMEATGQIRYSKDLNRPIADKSLIILAGIRWNIFNRHYDF
jgi:hypothetical protein